MNASSKTPAILVRLYDLSINVAASTPSTVASIPIFYLFESALTRKLKALSSFRPVEVVGGVYGWSGRWLDGGGGYVSDARRGQFRIRRLNQGPYQETSMILVSGGNQEKDIRYE